MCIDRDHYSINDIVSNSNGVNSNKYPFFCLINWVRVSNSNGVNSNSTSLAEFSATLMFQTPTE